MLVVRAGVSRGTLSFKGPRTRWGWFGWLLMVYALLYLAINAADHGTLTRIPTFGLPSPTTIFTAGALMQVAAAPQSLAIIPIVWSLIGGSASVLLGLPADYALPVAGVALAAYVVTARSLRGSPSVLTRVRA